MAVYDAIVLGVGGVGSAALAHLARRGASVLGIDRFAPGHDRGSSHGQTRLIRQAYYEHPDYVPLVRRAFELWKQLEDRAGEPLYRETGLLQIGPPVGEVLRGVRASAARHGLAIEQLSATEALARFPAFRLPSDCEAVFETRAGFLLVERCVMAQAADAQRAGAALCIGESVQGWSVEKGVVHVRTDRGQYQAKNLVIAAGAWSSELLDGIGVPLVVLRKPLYWWQTKTDAYRADRSCPAFLYELPEGTFYGLPQIDSAGVKVAEHSGGAVVADPLAIARESDPAEAQRVAEFVGQYLTDATVRCTQHAVCMYTMSPDGHFVVDRHPGFPQVVFAAGLSGHGFKFACVLGEALSQLVLDGKTQLPIGFLSLARLRPRASA